VERGCSEVAGLGVVGRREGEGALRPGAGVGEGGDVHEAVEGKVGAKLLVDDLLGFEGEHGPVLAGEELGEGDGVDAHVGADLDHQPGGRLGVGEDLQEGFDFELATLAVVEEGLPHENVIAVDEHGAVAGGQELVVRSDGDALHGHAGAHGDGRSARGIVGGILERGWGVKRVLRRA